MVKSISKAERVAIERHRIEMCKSQCREVTEEEALADWLDNHFLGSVEKYKKRWFSELRDTCGCLDSDCRCF